MAYGATLEAEYKDGFVLSEAEHNDVSPYEHLEQVDDLDDDGNVIGNHIELIPRNIFRAIIERRAEAEHGPMVRFTILIPGRKYDIDFSAMPADAKPIYYRHMERQLNEIATEYIGEAYATAHYFGYEYHDAKGKKHKEIIEIK